MAYFSTGSEGLDYESQYCENCQNWKDNGSGVDGCIIMDLHARFNYDQCGTKNPDKAKLLEEILNHFIQYKDCHNEECRMFLPLNTPDIPGQLKLDF